MSDFPESSICIPENETSFSSFLKIIETCIMAQFQYRINRRVLFEFLCKNNSQRETFLKGLLGSLDH